MKIPNSLTPPKKQTITATATGSNVANFPRFKITDVVASLRTLANQIESGERPVVRAVVCMEGVNGFDYCAMGDDLGRLHAIGLLRLCEREIEG